jgi:hypothetical protein
VLYIAKLKLIAEVVSRMKELGLTEAHMLHQVTTRITEFTKHAENSNDVLSMQLALAVDIELDLFLVPKAWAFEIVTTGFAQFCLSLIRQMKNPFLMAKRLTALQSLVERISPGLITRLDKD